MAKLTIMNGDEVIARVNSSSFKHSSDVVNVPYDVDEEVRLFLDVIKIERQRDQLREALDAVLDDALFANPAVIEKARAALKATEEG